MIAIIYVSIAFGVLLAIGLLQGLTDGEDDPVACILVALFWPVALPLIVAYSLGCFIRRILSNPPEA